MGIIRTVGAFIGTDEATLSTPIADGGSAVGPQIDVLGDDTSEGEAFLYLVYLFTVGTTTGSIDLKLNNIRISQQIYSKTNFGIRITPDGSTAARKIPIGKVPVSRFMNAEVRNNATGQPVQVAILFELFKSS
jgi:hypothetical protein